MNRFFPRLLLTATIVACLASSACAQHCPPIVESYLSGTSLKRSKEGIDFEMQYTKTGGRPKAAYQVYLVVYSDSKREEVAKMSPQKAIEEGLATIVHTQVASANEWGEYEFEYRLETKSFVKSMLEFGGISDERVTDIGGWKKFTDSLRVAVFIPHLDDEKYSVLEGLPEDKHECHFGPALLFETLNQRLEVCFGIVQAVKLTAGKHHIQINGNRPEAVKED